jgi:sugar phosphate isomerase/epimerase
MFLVGCKIDEIRTDGDLNAFRRDLEKYAKLGMKAVELPVHGLDAIREGVLDRRRVQEILGILQDFDFAYSVHSPNPLNLMDCSNPDLHYSVFQCSLEFAGQIGAKILVYHAGRFIPEETFGIPLIPERDKVKERQFLEKEAEALLRLSEEFPGVVIGVENARPYLFHSPYCYGERLSSLKEQVERVNRPNVRITLDIGHMHMASRFYGFNSREAVKSIKDLIAHTHIHDNFGGAIYHNEKIQTHQIPFGRGDSHMPVGWAAIPFQAILSAYISSYSGMLIMELRNRYFNQLKESKANLMDLLKSLRAESALFSQAALASGPPG